MAKLTDSQLIVLSKAASREDGLVITPAKMNKAAAAKVGSSLIARKLMRELKTKPGMPIWREDEDGRGISLMITRAGREAIGVDDEADSVANKESPPPSTQKRDKAANDVRKPTRKNVSTPASPSPRKGSKQELVIGLLSDKAGATLDALVDATGWLPHTTRAALTGLRKRGFSIERSRNGDKASIYRIVSRTQESAGA